MLRAQLSKIDRFLSIQELHQFVHDSDHMKLIADVIYIVEAINENKMKCLEVKVILEEKFESGNCSYKKEDFDLFFQYTHLIQSIVNNAIAENNSASASGNNFSELYTRLLEAVREKGMLENFSEAAKENFNRFEKVAEKFKPSISSSSAISSFTSLQLGAKIKDVLSRSASAYLTKMDRIELDINGRDEIPK